MKLTAIKKVLGQYRHTEEGVVTEEMITAAWAEVAETEEKLAELKGMREHEGLDDE